jgi:hypothetical protein
MLGVTIKSIMPTFSITLKNETLDIVTINAYAEYCYAECHNEVLCRH